MTAPLPSDRSQVMRVTLVTAISVLAVLVIGMGAWAIFKPHPKGPGQSTFTPAQETTSSARPETTTATASVSPSDTQGSSGSTSTGGGAKANWASAGIRRAPKVAFRLGSSIYVAGEDGSAAKAVSPSAEGPYALSPDGLKLAVVDSGQLRVVDVEGGKAVAVGVAEAVAPVWMPDSSAVLFVRAGANGVAQVLRVPVAGGAAKVLGAGIGGAVSPDGSVVALLQGEESGTPAISVSRGGAAFTQLPAVSGTPLGLAAANDCIYVSTLSTSGAAAVYAVSLNGGASRQIVAPDSGAGKGATYGSLLLSPDGTRIFYAAEGDDGYSRMWLARTAGGSPVSLFPRRDNYPVQWASDGATLLFVEGNSFQGEPTALYRSNPDGTRRLMIVSGALL